MGNCLGVQLQLSCDQALNHVCGSLCGDGNPIHKMEDNIESMQTSMQELIEVHDDLLTRVKIEEDKGLQRLAQVQGWLLRVEGIESQVNDLLTASTSEIKKLCICGYCSKSFKSSSIYGKKVFKKMREIENLKVKGGSFVVVTSKIPIPMVEKKYIQPTVVGLKTVFERAWNLLLKDDVRTLGFYGMGGVGKTTLQAHINNKFLDSANGFDIVIWVVVSKDLQIGDIQEQIRVRLGFGKEWKQQTEKERAIDIYNVLSRKRFVLLLDDLWSEVDLNKIGVPLSAQENGWKIALTTRYENICKEMKVSDDMELSCLAPEDAWKLFQSNVGEVTLRRHADIPKLAKEIAQKCCGLPLALNVIGMVMSCKRTIQEWSRALEVLSFSSHEFPGMEEKILGILKFSYDNLSDERVKWCFLYCSLFSEDYEIRKDELIDFWMCEGFIDGYEDGANNLGHDIIGSLVHSHLLMGCELVSRVKMHDVIREMAIWIASDLGKQKETFIVKTGAMLCHLPEINNCGILRRMSLMNNKIERISKGSKCPQLTTLFLRKNKLVDISGEFFCWMPKLVVLDLSWNVTLTKLPDEISSLVSLRYLNLSLTKISCFSDGLKKLSKLIYSNLDYTTELQSISGISDLPSLQVLKIFSSGVPINLDLLKELESLEYLQLLTLTLKDVNALNSLQRVQRLASCTQALSLSKMSASNVSLIVVALAGLHRLELEGSNISEIEIIRESNENKEVINSINPFPDILLSPDAPCLDILKSASIPCFHNLSVVTLRECRGLKDLSWLIFSQNLTHLLVVKSPQIEDIINKDKVVGTQELMPFGKLDYLGFQDLNELKSVYWNHLPFPNLRKIHVEKCPKLRKLPLDSQSANGNYFSIPAEQKWIEELKWEDDATKQQFSSMISYLDMRI